MIKMACGRRCVVILLLVVFQDALSAVTDTEIELILTKHNQARSAAQATNMQKMYWDASLADSAQEWADNCDFSHNTWVDRDQGWGVTVGQNIAYTTGAHDWTTPLDLWEGEIVDFVYNDPSVSSSGVGHYTQMVYATTPLVGCGHTDCANLGEFYVCEYAAGQSSSMMITPYGSGTVCSECPDNCVDNMCDCGGKLCQWGGTLNENTCDCSCDGYASGDDCSTFNCPESDSSYCDGTEDYCTVATNWAGICPNMCGTCDQA